MRLSGFTFDYNELVTWKYRAINGPYKTTGDAFTYSPGSWDDVVIRANKFYNDEVTDYWDGDVNSWETQAYGHYILACAFYGIIKEDDLYRQKAADAILLQAQNTTNPDFEFLEATYPENRGNAFHFSGVMARLFIAFDYTYDLWSPADIATYETWMERGVSYWELSSNYYPYLCYPNRDDEDYSVIEWWAASGQEKTTDWLYTYTDDAGIEQNYTRACHQDYNNRDGLMSACMFLWALYTNDTRRIFDAKRYIKEGLMFGTWPDGFINDDALNGVYDRASTGAHWYRAVCLEIIFFVAELCRKKLNDLELYNFSTDEGIWGCDGQYKTIRGLVDTHCELIRQSPARYWGSVSEANRLYVLNGTYRFNTEQCIAIANNYFNDDYVKRISECEYSGWYYDPAYSYPSYTARGDDKWVGSSGLYAALPLQEYDMGVINPQGNKSLLL